MSSLYRKLNASLPAWSAIRITRCMWPYATRAICDKQVVGTFALLIMDNLGHLGAPSAVVEDVAVDPEWQAQGVGKVMMYHALWWLAKKDVTKQCFHQTSNVRGHTCFTSRSDLSVTATVTESMPRPRIWRIKVEDHPPCRIVKIRLKTLFSV